ncbi:MAG TPA: hypothetical protein DHW49_14665 [Anaerolineae bacterium]|nr:hypothetical protein [Anaerolineae bacterium]
MGLLYNRAIVNFYFGELTLSRLINPDSVGKERTRLSKAIVLCIRELAKQKQVTQDAKDQAAYIALALQAIADGIDASVAAWEKRDYWVKADKFRMEWMWSGQYAVKMKEAVLTDDWATIATLMPKLAEKFNKIEVSDNHRLGTPWSSAYKLLALHQKI